MKKTALFLSLFSIFFVASHAYAACQFDRKTMGVSGTGCPKNVADFVERTNGCQHFGSEPYDLNDEWGHHRKAELDQQMKKLRCDTLLKEKAALLKQYKNQPDISDFITHSDTLR